MSSSLFLALAPLARFLEEEAPKEGGGGSLLIPMALVMGIFYFVLIAPERKKQKKREAMLGSMKKGERVMTTSGMYGSVVQVKEDVVVLQVADNVRLRFSKAAVQTLLDREESKDAGKKGAKPEADELQESV